MLGGQPNLSIVNYKLSNIPAVFFDNFLKFGSTEISFKFQVPSQENQLET